MFSRDDSSRGCIFIQDFIDFILVGIYLHHVEYVQESTITYLFPFPLLTYPANNLPLLDLDDLVDITDELFASLLLIQDHRVVKSEYFNLLEGTQAIEMLNPKLDTGLIDISHEDILFDTATPLSIDEVISINNSLLISFVSWLDNSNLPVTVLSCRYVQTVLENYTKRKSLDLPLSEKCSLVNERLGVVGTTPKAGTANNDSVGTATSSVGAAAPVNSDSAGTISVDDSFESKLVHLVLKSFIIGLCKFIGLCLQIAMNILYEEEDLTTRNMNLDFLLAVPVESVLHEIESAINWLKSCENSKTSILINQLELLTNLNQFESIFHLTLPVLQDYQGTTTPQKLPFLTNGIKQSQMLDFSSITVPPHSFSKFIQSDLDNKNIPIKLYQLEPSIAHEKLTGIFTAIESFIGNCRHISNHQQLLNFLHYDISLNIKNISVISRAIFQLFFIRDNKSILGSPNIYLDFDFISSLIANLVGPNTAILSPDAFNNSGLKVDLVVEITTALTQSIQELESAVYHTLTLYGNNPCRQQQLMSRGLLIWDTLQVSWENFESELFNSFKIGEELLSGDIGLTVSSYVYYNKLTFMFQLLIRGIDLDLYKHYEYYLVYWYGNYLIKLIIELLQGRIYDILQSKINFIEKVLPKRFKKLKAGVKKQQLKDLIQYNQTVTLPKLQNTLEYHSAYLIPSYQGMLELIEGVRMYLVILSSFGVIDFLNSTPNSLVPFESLFNLRLKPWSSIGVPRLPTFQHYRQSLDLPFLQNPSTSERTKKTTTLLSVVQQKFSASKSIHQKILQQLQENPAVKNQFLPSTVDHVETSYKQLIKSSISYSLQVDNLLKLLKDGRYEEINSQNYKLTIDVGYHRYFPNITLGKV